ncbi:MAG: MBL fold metallo-hydrolase, partial [Bacillota bacterium]|nr:MBL fold metallo-hydrolase [Bacillota bacterium]
MPVQLTVFNLSTTLANGPGVIHPTLLHDETHAMLIDAGMPEGVPMMLTEMQAAGVPPERLTHIVITHADLDHVSGLKTLLSACPNARVYCHEKEKPYVQGDVPPLRLAAMEAGLQNLTGETLAQMTALAQRLRANYKNLSVPVAGTLKEGEALPCDARVIETPGHTPGHICLYEPQSRTLIAGDLFNVEDGKLALPPE